MGKVGKLRWYVLISLMVTQLRVSWQAQSQVLNQMQNAGLAGATDRRRDDRRRASQGGNIVPPSPALVRHGSKQRKNPNALAPGEGGSPGQLTPLSAAAHVNVPVGNPQLRGSPQHPYANASGGGYDYHDENFAQQQPYGRASPMVSSVGAAPPAISNIRARAGDVGVSQGGQYQGQEDAPPKPSLLRILTCRCG